MAKYTARSWQTETDAEALLEEAAGSPSVPRSALVLAACACARLALAHAVGPRPRRALELAEAWTRGKATDEAVAQAAADVSVITDVGGLAARAAARAADWAAETVDGYGNTVAAEAASSIASAAYNVPLDHAPRSPDFRAALSDSVEREALRKMAILVREHIPWAALSSRPAP